MNEQCASMVGTRKVLSKTFNLKHSEEKILKLMNDHSLYYSWLMPNSTSFLFLSFLSLFERQGF